MQIKVGDSVKYSKLFLQSNGQYCGDVPNATGTATRTGPFAGGLATVQWDNESVVFMVHPLNRMTRSAPRLRSRRRPLNPLGLCVIN
jgi:hypothetical protein